MQRRRVVGRHLLVQFGLGELQGNHVHPAGVDRIADDGGDDFGHRHIAADFDEMLEVNQRDTRPDRRADLRDELVAETALGVVQALIDQPGDILLAQLRHQHRQAGAGLVSQVIKVHASLPD